MSVLDPSALLDKAARGERLDHAEITRLFELPLGDVAAVAHGLRLVRAGRVPDGRLAFLPAA